MSPTIPVSPVLPRFVGLIEPDGTSAKWEWHICVQDTYAALARSLTLGGPPPKMRSEHSAPFAVGGVAWRLLAQHGRDGVGVFLERAEKEGPGTVDAHFQLQTLVVAPTPAGAAAAPASAEGGGGARCASPPAAAADIVHTSRHLFAAKTPSLGFGSQAPFDALFGEAASRKGGAGGGESAGPPPSPYLHTPFAVTRSGGRDRRKHFTVHCLIKVVAVCGVAPLDCSAASLAAASASTTTSSPPPAPCPFRGIRNQGATCYLNSLLQTLYHLKAFRQLAYSLAAQAAADARGLEEPYDALSKSIPFTLARLFYELQAESGDTDAAAAADAATQGAAAAAAADAGAGEAEGGAAGRVYSEAATTRALTAAFGWNQDDALQQHDVQELARKLMDCLEEKMAARGDNDGGGNHNSSNNGNGSCNGKGRGAAASARDNPIRQLFIGSVRNFIKCTDIDYQSSRTEQFYDLQLCVRGTGSVRRAFEEELRQETLSGENAYRAVDEATGLSSLQRAKRGIEFLRFPPVLFLHLRRFEYDYACDGFTKVGDTLEFPESLDLAPFYRTEGGGGGGDAGSPASSPNSKQTATTDPDLLDCTSYSSSASTVSADGALFSDGGGGGGATARGARRQSSSSLLRGRGHRRRRRSDPQASEMLLQGGEAAAAAAGVVHAEDVEDEDEAATDESSDRRRRRQRRRSRVEVTTNPLVHPADADGGGVDACGGGSSSPSPHSSSSAPLSSRTLRRRQRGSGRRASQQGASGAGAGGGGSKCSYRLHSVLVHSGNVVGGHYYSFVRPGGGVVSPVAPAGSGGGREKRRECGPQQWYCFDDVNVREVEREEAVDDNYGGVTDSEKFWLHNSKAGVSTSAYMLVYVQADAARTILGCDVKVPKALRDDFAYFDAAQKRRWEAEAEQERCFIVHVTTAQDLAAHNREMGCFHADLCLPGYRAPEPLKLSKRASYAALVAALNAFLGQPGDGLLRIFRWTERINETVRLHGPLTKLPSSLQQTQQQQQQQQGQRSPTSTAPPPREPLQATTPLCDIFAPAPPPGSGGGGGGGGGRQRLPSNELWLHAEPGRPLRLGEVFLTLKEHRAGNGSAPLLYRGSVCVSRHARLSDLHMTVHQLAGPPPPRHALRLWEERRASLIVPLLNMAETIAGCNLCTGDIVIFQHCPAHVVSGAPSKSQPLADPEMLFRRELSKKEVTAVEVGGARPPASVTLGMDDAAPDVLASIAEACDAPRTHMRLLYMGETVGPGLKLHELLSHDNVIQYEILSISVAELAERLEVACAHYDEDSSGRLSLTVECKLTLDKACSVQDCLTDIADRINARSQEAAAPDSGGDVYAAQLRLTKIRNHRIEELLVPSDDMRRHVEPGVTFRSERIAHVGPKVGVGSDAEPVAPDAYAAVAVCQFERLWPGAPVLSLHSAPFVSYVCESDSHADVLRRFASRVGVTKEARIGGWKLCLLRVERGRESCLGVLTGSVQAALAERLGDDAGIEALNVLAPRGEQEQAESAEGTAARRASCTTPVALMLGIDRRDESRSRAAVRGVKIEA